MLQGLCNGKVPVHLSVRLFVAPMTAACRCGGFAAVGPARNEYRLIAGAAAARCSAANASSVTLSADVRSMNTDLFIRHNVVKIACSY